MLTRNKGCGLCCTHSRAVYIQCSSVNPRTVSNRSLSGSASAVGLVTEDYHTAEKALS